VQHKTTRGRGPKNRIAYVAFLVLLLGVASLALAACGSSSSSSSSSSEETAPAESETETTEPAEEESETKSSGSEASGEPIGIAGLEGEVTEGGADFSKGMKIATEQINSEGGVNGRPIDLKIIKTGGSPQGSATAYEQAAGESNILGVFLGASGALTLRDQSERTKLPLIGADGNDNMDFPVTPYIFQNAAGGEYGTSGLVYMDEHGAEYAKAFGRKWSGGTMKGKKLAIFYTEADWGQMVPIAMKEGCEQLGCEIVDEEEGGVADSVEALTPQLTKMKESGAEVYFIEGVNANVFKAVEQLGMDELPVVSDQNLTVPALAEADGKSGEGVVFGGHKCRIFEELEELDTTPDPTVEWCKTYRARFEKEFPGEPYAQYSIYGYDAVNTYAWAVNHLEEEEKEVTRESVAEAMQEMNGSLRTSHGLVKTSPESHRLTGTWEEAYVILNYTIGKGGEAEYHLAPGADPEGSKAIGKHVSLQKSLE
jgi:branched-chain amino acid transport system substrate-binding protein